MQDMTWGSPPCNNKGKEAVWLTGCCAMMGSPELSPDAGLSGAALGVTGSARTEGASTPAHWSGTGAAGLALAAAACRWGLAVTGTARTGPACCLLTPLGVDGWATGREQEPSECRRGASGELPRGSGTGTALRGPPTELRRPLPPACMVSQPAASAAPGDGCGAAALAGGRLGDMSSAPSVDLAGDLGQLLLGLGLLRAGASPLSPPLYPSAVVLSRCGPASGAGDRGPRTGEGSLVGELEVLRRPARWLDALQAASQTAPQPHSSCSPLPSPFPFFLPFFFAFLLSLSFSSLATSSSSSAYTIHQCWSKPSPS